jgi:hypothetical protein
VTDLHERQRRLERARTLGRFELFVAFAAMPLALFLLLAAPGRTAPMFWQPTLMETLMPWVGAALYVFGVAWMIWIYRTDPDAGDRSWRYHDL